MRATSARQSIGRPKVRNSSGSDSEKSSPRIQIVCAALSTFRDTVSFKMHARFEKHAFGRESRLCSLFESCADLVAEKSRAS